MSKASEWAKRKDEAERNVGGDLLLEVSGGWVLRDGSTPILWLSDDRYGAADALNIARWILDTFEEPRS